MTKRIFDDPNHPHYGPVRRMWVILVQLDIFTDAEYWKSRFGAKWDEALSSMLARGTLTEAQGQRRLLLTILQRAY